MKTPSNGATILVYEAIAPRLISLRFRFEVLALRDVDVLTRDQPRIAFH